MFTCATKLNYHGLKTHSSSFTYNIYINFKMLFVDCFY